MEDLKGMPSFGVKVQSAGVRMNGSHYGKTEAELAEYMFRERMAHRIAAAVRVSLDEEEASRMNAAGVTLMQYRRKHLLGSAAAVWPYPRKEAA